jgi:hypothetical protein
VSPRYEAVYRRTEPVGGERRLLLAVLEDGIRTFLKSTRATHGRALKLRRVAFSWLTIDDRSDVFSSRTSVRRSASMRRGCGSEFSAKRRSSRSTPFTERRLAAVADGSGGPERGP